MMADRRGASEALQFRRGEKPSVRQTAIAETVAGGAVTEPPGHKGQTAKRTAKPSAATCFRGGTHRPKSQRRPCAGIAPPGDIGDGGRANHEDGCRTSQRPFFGTAASPTASQLQRLTRVREAMVLSPSHGPGQVPLLQLGEIGLLVPSFVSTTVQA